MQAIHDRLMQAASIGYTADGTSGKTFLDVMRRLGIQDAIAARLVPMGPGYATTSPAVAVALGDVGLAIGPLTTMLAAKDVAPVAIFPGELGTDIDMSLFRSTAAAEMPGALALSRFLTDPTLDRDLTARVVARFAFA